MTLRASDDQWEVNAELFKAALEDKPNLASATIVFPRMLELLGKVEGCKVLDYGCGAGRFSKALAERGAAVTAYDSSPAQIELARNSNDHRAIRYISNIVEAPEGYFECAICFQVLVCNPLQGVKGIIQDVYSRLRPRGRAAFVNTNTAVVGRSYDGGFTKMPETSVLGAPYLRHLTSSKGDFEVVDYWYPPDDLRRLFDQRDFTTKREEVIEESFVLHIVEK